MLCWNINIYDINIINTKNTIISQLKTSKPSIQINTSGLIEGLYIVQLLYNGKSYTKQLVIGH